MKVIYFAVILAMSSGLAVADAYAWKIHIGSNGNTVVQHQSDNSNVSITVQTPHRGDSAKTYQNGSNNVAIIVQSGSGQHATIKQ